MKKCEIKKLITSIVLFMTTSWGAFRAYDLLEQR